jgi:hypothetical protein
LRVKTTTKVGLEVAVQAQANFRANYHASASITAGYEFKSGSWKTIQNTDLQLPTAGGKKGLQIVGLEGSYAMGRVYIMPIVELIFSYVGGPRVSLKNYVEATGKIGSATSTLSINAGFEGSIGGKFYLKIGPVKLVSDIEFADRAIVAKVTPLLSRKNWLPPSMIDATCPVVYTFSSGTQATCDSLRSRYPDKWSCQNLLSEDFMFNCHGCNCCKKPSGYSKTCDEYVALEYTCEQIKQHFGEACNGCGIMNSYSSIFQQHCSGTRRSLNTISPEINGPSEMPLADLLGVEHANLPKRRLSVAGSKSWEIVGNTWVGEQRGIGSNCNVRNADVTVRLLEITPDLFSKYTFSVTTYEHSDGNDVVLDQKAYGCYAFQAGQPCTFQPLNENDVSDFSRLLNYGSSIPGGYGTWIDTVVEIYQDVDFGDVLNLRSGCGELTLQTADGRGTNNRMLGTEDDQDRFLTSAEVLADIETFDDPDPMHVEDATRAVNSCYQECLQSSGRTLRVIEERDRCSVYFDMLGDMCSHCGLEEPAEVFRLQAICLEDNCHKNECRANERQQFVKADYYYAKLLLHSPDERLTGFTSVGLHDLFQKSDWSELLLSNPRFKRVIKIDTSLDFLEYHYGTGLVNATDFMEEIDIEFGWLDLASAQISRNHLEDTVDSPSGLTALSNLLGVEITHAAVLESHTEEGLEHIESIGLFKDLTGEKDDSGSVDLTVAIACGAAGAGIAFLVVSLYVSGRRRERTKTARAMATVPDARQSGKNTNAPTHFLAI